MRSISNSIQESDIAVYTLPKAAMPGMNACTHTDRACTGLHSFRGIHFSYTSTPPAHPTHLTLISHSQLTILFQLHDHKSFGEA